MKRFSYSLCDIHNAREFAINNYSTIVRARVCGCFNCNVLLLPMDVIDFVEDPEGKESSALCPFCKQQTVISDISGYPMKTDFLKEVNDYWIKGKR